MTDETPPPAPWSGLAGDPRSTPRWGAAVPPEPLEEVRLKLAALEQLEQQRIGAARTLRIIWLIFGGVATAAAIAAAGWVWTLHGSTVEAVAQLERVSERLDDHMRRGGPQGHPDSVLARTAVNEGRLDALSRSMSSLERALERQDAKLDDILSRLPSGRRGGD